MPAIGRMNTLTVSRITSAGTYLDGGQLGDIFSIYFKIERLFS